MKAFVEKITPERARFYLAKNTSNYRKMNRNKVLMYARDMRSGKWQENGESIKFNKTGKLVDGQHRLQAIVESGVPVKMMVVTDVDEDVTLFDCGKNRSVREIGIAEGIEPRLVENSMASAVAVILMGDPRGYKVGGSSNAFPTKPEIINHIKSHEYTWHCVAEVMKGARDNPTRKGIVFAAVYLMLSNGADMEELSDFMSVANTGFPISGRESTPAIVLRNMLMWNTDKAENRVLLFSATVDAFNDFTKGVSRRKTYTKINRKTLDLLSVLCELEK